MKGFFTENTWLQFIRFLVAGGISTAWNYALFALLYFAGFNYLFAAATGYITGFFLGFVLFKKFTFKSGAPWKSEIFKQIGVYSFSLGLNLLTLYALVHFAGVSALLANIVAIAVSTVTNFVGMKLFVFRATI